MYYTDNDFQLYHSAKGSTWKKHKDISKIGVGESARYKYSIKDTTEAIGDKIDNIGDKVYDDLGLRDREIYQQTKKRADRYQNNYNEFTKYDDNPEDSYLYYLNELGQQALRRTEERYYSTPIGSVEKYINAGKEAVNAFTSYLDKYK